MPEMNNPLPGSEVTTTPGAVQSPVPGGQNPLPSDQKFVDFTGLQDMMSKQGVQFKTKVGDKDVVIPPDQFAQRFGQYVGRGERYDTVAQTLREMNVDPASPTFKDDLGRAISERREEQLAGILENARDGNESAREMLATAFGLPWEQIQRLSQSEPAVTDLANNFDPNQDFAAYVRQTYGADEIDDPNGSGQKIKTADAIIRDLTGPSPVKHLAAIYGWTAQQAKTLRTLAGRGGNAMSEDKIRQTVSDQIARIEFGRQVESVERKLTERYPDTTPAFRQAELAAIVQEARSSGRSFEQIAQERMSGMAGRVVRNASDVPPDIRASIEAEYAARLRDASASQRPPPPGTTGGPGTSGVPAPKTPQEWEAYYLSQRNAGRTDGNVVGM